MPFCRIVLGLVLASFVDFAQAKEVISQNSCLVLIEAHTAQTYRKVYIATPDSGMTEAKVLFKNEDTWQVQLKKNCDKDFVGQLTFGYLTETEQETKKGTEEKQLKILTKRPLDPATKRARRRSRSGIGAGVELGFAYSQIPIIGFHGKYFLSQTLGARFFYRLGSTQEGTNTISVNELGAGAGYHQSPWINYSLELKRTATDVGVKSSLQSYDTKKIAYRFGLAVGSSFDWNSVRISCDWISLNVSLYETKTSTFKADSKNQTSKAVDPQEDYSLGSFRLLLMQSTFIF